MKRRDDDANLSCSFCGKSQREVLVPLGRKSPRTAS